MGLPRALSGFWLGPQPFGGGWSGITILIPPYSQVFCFIIHWSDSVQLTCVHITPIPARKIMLNGRMHTDIIYHLYKALEQAKQVMKEKQNSTCLEGMGWDSLKSTRALYGKW